jgi:hypothetical protein
VKKILIIGLLLHSSVTLADDEKPEVIYKKRTEIDFEALELEGELVKPQGNLILERKRAVFNPLIKLKEDFNTEITDSVKNIQ